jgi:dihydroorotase
MDLIIRGGTLVTADSVMEADILIEDGQIAGLYKPGSPVDSSVPVLEAAGLHVIPGAIDVHVHFREPGLEQKEDFLSGSGAAAVGGITTVCDMPNTLPPIATADLLRTKVDKLQGRSYVDYGLYGVILPDNLEQVDAMLNAGAVALKIFAGPTTGNLGAPSWGALVDVFQAVAKRGGIIALHAEDRETVEYWEQRVKGEGGSTYEDLLASRPAFSEASAIAQATLLSAQTGCRLHVVHLNTKEGVDLIGFAKQQGAPVTTETCPPYLLLTAADYGRIGNRMKVLPYIRHQADQERLWGGLLDGTIDMLSTDHAPHLPEEKARDIWSAPAGAPGVETLLPLMLDQVNKGRLTLSELVRMTSLRPAQAYGLYPRKGAVRMGSDGDFTLVDLKKRYTLRAEEMLSKARQNPFDGVTVTGMPVATVVRGQVVAREGKIVGQPRGEWLRPPEFCA